MAVYLVQLDQDETYVETDSIGNAVALWQLGREDEDEEPDSVFVVSLKSVRRDGWSPS